MSKQRQWTETPEERRKSEELYRAWLENTEYVDEDGNVVDPDTIPMDDSPDDDDPDE